MRSTRGIPCVRGADGREAASTARRPRRDRPLDAVDRRSTAPLLTELLAVASVGGSDAEADVQHVLAEQLTPLGLDVDLWRMDLPVLAASAGFPGTEPDRAEAWELVGASPGGGEGPALVLQGHVDVVPARDRSAGACRCWTPQTGCLHWPAS